MRGAAVAIVCGPTRLSTSGSAQGPQGPRGLWWYTCLDLIVNKYKCTTSQDHQPTVGAGLEVFPAVPARDALYDPGTAGEKPDHEQERADNPPGDPEGRQDPKPAPSSDRGNFREFAKSKGSTEQGADRSTNNEVACHTAKTPLDEPLERSRVRGFCRFRRRALNFRRHRQPMSA